jgi:hypothetical protein
MKKLIIALLLVLTACFANAQVTIKPGDKIIRYDWIKPSHDFYRNQVSDTSGKVIYDFMMDDYTFIDQANKRIAFARTRQVPAGSFEADTSITDLSLKPVSMHEVHPQRDVTYEMIFGDEQTMIKTIRKSVPLTKTYPMKSGYFEDNMIEYIFGYLELKKGIIYTLDNFNKDAPAPSDPYAVEYAFDDVWQLTSDHKVNCTVLHFTHGGTTGYIWIDKSTHLMVKTIANFKTGSYMLTKV